VKTIILSPKIYTTLVFILIGAVLVTSRCKDKKPEETPKPFVSESYVMVDDGVELRLKTIGNGSEAVVISPAIYLEYEFEKLIDGSRTLVFYDVRGRGKSSKIENSSRIGMESEISDLEAIRLHLEKEKISLIGWSYHGAMAVLYAAKYPNHINRVIQVGALAPTSEIQKRAISTPMDSESQSLLEDLKSKGLDKTDPERYCVEYGDIYMKRIFYNPLKISQFHSDRCQCENEMPENVAFHLNAIFTSIGEWDWTWRVKDLEIPVLAIHGISDPSCPLEGSRLWTSLFRNARLLAVPNAGHMPFVENPDLFYPSVDTFLKGGWPERAEVVGVPVPKR
jgi:pimeloyl-ACP methyl ester carboxylesterase